MNILIFGAPSAGKGTQAELIKEKYGLNHISTGNIFRYNVKNNTALGLKVKDYLSKGELVPDEITVELVADAISKLNGSGFLLDGFPRNVFQAEALDEILEENGMKIDAVVNIDVKEELLIGRIIGRRICKECGASYHIEYSPPKVEGKCDKCGGEVYQRSDDTEEVYKERYNIYLKQTLPLIYYYCKRGTLKNVDGNKKPIEVFEAISELLGDLV